MMAAQANETRAKNLKFRQNKDKDLDLKGIKALNEFKKQHKKQLLEEIEAIG